MQSKFDHLNFIDDLKMTGIYNKKFLEGMEGVQEDIRKGKVKRFNSSEDFMKAL